MRSTVTRHRISSTERNAGDVRGDSSPRTSHTLPSWSRGHREERLSCVDGAICDPADAGEAFK